MYTVAALSCGSHVLCVSAHACMYAYVCSVFFILTKQHVPLTLIQKKPFVCICRDFYFVRVNDVAGLIVIKVLLSGRKYPTNMIKY